MVLACGCLCVYMYMYMYCLYTCTSCLVLYCDLNPCHLGSSVAGNSSKDRGVSWVVGASPTWAAHVPLKQELSPVWLCCGVLCCLVCCLVCYLCT